MNLGLSQGQPGFVPGTNWVCPWDKPGVVPRATGPKSLCLCAFFLPDSNFSRPKPTESLKGHKCLCCHSWEPALTSLRFLQTCPLQFQLLPMNRCHDDASMCRGHLETILACRWDGVRLPASFWKVPRLPRISLSFPRSSSATSPGWPGPPQRSTPFSGKPDTLRRLTISSNEMSRPKTPSLHCSFCVSVGGSLCSLCSCCCCAGFGLLAPHGTACHQTPHPPAQPPTPFSSSN